MNFSGKMCFEIILKVTKNHGFTLSLEETFFEKPSRGGVGVWGNLTPPGILGFTPLVYTENEVYSEPYQISMMEHIIKNPVQL